MYAGFWMAPAASRPVQLPAIREWRNDTLTISRKISRGLPEAATRCKQEIYRQKGEARRKAIAARRAQAQTLVRGPSPSYGTIKPPLKQRNIAPTVTAQPEIALFELPTARPPLPPADSLPQSIISRYEDYKWSVYRYEMLPGSGYDFAERWVEALLATTLQSAYEDRHFSHISRGFSQDGGRHYILVLHNATNPFEYSPTPTSTITIGVYGYHWYQHSAIHWTTLATDQRALLAQCVEADLIQQTHKWTFDTPKASEGRFHRAYWLAANRRDLKGLLNCRPSDDRPHDLIEDRSEEDSDGEFSISESDLGREWNVTDAEAAMAWERVQDEVGMGGEMDVQEVEWQHFTISNSE